MITPSDAMEMLKEWLEENPKIKEELKIEQFSANQATYEAITQELADALYDEGALVTNTPKVNLFDYSSEDEIGSAWDYPIRVRIKGGAEGTTPTGIITIDKNALRKDSLSYPYGENGPSAKTGGGIDDIVALFTKGYTPRGQVYGFWEGPGVNISGHTRSDGSPGLNPNPFIRELIDSFKNKYPDIILDITYPRTWHS